MIALSGRRPARRHPRKERALKRLLIVTAATVALGAALVAAPAGAGGDFVYAPKNCNKPKVEPKRITLACADAGIQLKSLGWNDWNAPKVKGQGKLLVKDCDPNCVSGGVDKYKVKVTLLNVQSYTCGGQTLPTYRRAHLRFPDKKPPNKNDLKSFKLFCNS
jgi:hypothetical protein